MENKLNRSELFAISTILFYGSFARTKYALTMGARAISYTALALGVELLLVLLAALLPTVKSRVLGALLSPMPICIIALRVFEDARLLRGGDFSYVPLWMFIASSAVLCLYLALHKISSVGRVAVIALTFALIFLVVLSAVYARDFDLGRIISSYSDKSELKKLIFASLAEALMIYLAKSFFACEQNDRAAKPPLEKPLPEKARRKLYFKLTLLGFLSAAVLRLAVTVGLLSLAHPKLYALAESSSTFAARLLYGVNLSPLISGGVYILTLLAFSFSLSLFVNFLRKS